MKRFSELDSEAFCRSAARRGLGLQLLFVSLAALLLLSVWAYGHRSWQGFLAGFFALLCAQTLAASWLLVGVRKRLLRLEGERDAFYQELLRLSAFSSLGEISSSIAHDLNNPLAIMNEEVGWMQDLLQGQDPSGHLRALGVRELRTPDQAPDPALRRDHPSHLELVQGGRRQAPDRGFERAAQQDARPFGERLCSGGITVKKALDPRLPPVSGNLPELRQVFLHITKNALDAMRGGGILTIATESMGDGSA